jgi:hypothetical protein
MGSTEHTVKPVSIKGVAGFPDVGSGFALRTRHLVAGTKYVEFRCLFLLSLIAAVLSTILCLLYLARWSVRQRY